MASTKRKAPNEVATISKSKPPRENHSSKRQRKNDDTTSTPAKPPASNSSSVLKQEEKAFPRGGGSALTPLEYKQIQIQATKDVLFEQSGKHGKRTTENDVIDFEGEPLPTRSKPETKRRKKSKTQSAGEDNTNVEAEIKIEGISYKKLIPGSIVLGQVNEITARDIVLALPNNLNGYIPLTAISDQLNSRIEKLINDDKNSVEDDEDDDEDGDDVDLKKMFHLGQYLRACVISTGEADPGSQSRVKKRIELSINPNLTNGSMKASDLSTHNVVQASVISNEEHGLVMDLGMESQKVKGFVSSKELGPQVNHTDVKPGAVYLCVIKNVPSDGQVVKLSPNHTKTDYSKNGSFLNKASTVDAFLPGTPVDFLVTNTTPSGISGKIMGVLDVTAEVFHSGLVDAQGLGRDIKIGSKAKGRIIYTFPDSTPKKLGISLLGHVISLSSRTISSGVIEKAPTDTLKLSSIVEKAQVVRVDPKIGLFLDIGVPGVLGFAHISRISDEKIDTLMKESGVYKIGSTHQARVVGFNRMDGMFIVSLEKKVLEQPFLRVQDIEIGQIVKGQIEKLITNQKGATNVLVKLADGISGMVPETHLADVRLQHPERKFKEGLKVKARVLWTDSEKGLVRLTLKKTLVNSDAELWQTYDTVSSGAQALGTIVSLSKTGAVVQFYGKVRAWLPVSEMSEAFIKDPNDHFYVGQTVNVRILTVNPSEERMTVTCKSSTSSFFEHQSALKDVQVKGTVNGVVSEKSSDFVTVKLESGATGLLRLGQMSDGSQKKSLSILKSIRVDQELKNLFVLNKTSQKPWVIFSNKSSLKEASEKGQLPSNFDSLVHGQTVTGFVRNITPERVFVEFANGLIGLLFKSQLEESSRELPDFGLRLDQTITSVVSHIDVAQQRFWLSMKKDHSSSTSNKARTENPAADGNAAYSDLTFGKSVEAKITSIKQTQLNVSLGENAQGRVDMSEVFDSWEEITDRKHPLRSFRKGQLIKTRILGLHDARSWRFLPISHRGLKNPVFELTAKKGLRLDTESDLLSLEKVPEGSEWIAFVNNIANGCLWVNLTPNVRGRIEFRDLTDNLAQLENVEKSFPIGSALKVRVKNVEVGTNRLDLTALLNKKLESVTWEDLPLGTVLPARVTKVTERSISVQLSDEIAATIGLSELADDFSKANPTIYKKNEIIRVKVVAIDKDSKKLNLSCRPSNILSSEIIQKDPQIANMSQLKVNDLVRGFIKNISEKGIFIELGSSVTAFVLVKDLSDEFLKDWKTQFELGQLVRGRITLVDPAINHVQMSLKKSHLENGYEPPVEFENLAVGQVVSGTVRKVYDYGVMIRVQNSANVAGLCHVSEMADQKVDDVKKIYTEGDLVKAIILKVDTEKRRLRFGLKASYLEGSSDESMAEDDEETRSIEDGSHLANMKDDDDDDEIIEDERVVLSDNGDEQTSSGEDESESSPSFGEDSTEQASASLATPFDWSGGDFTENKKALVNSESEEESSFKKKKKKKPEIKADRTGDLDKYGPQSVADFERLLLGKPHSSLLWIEYMAFQLKLNEIDKAREIAQRALRTIDPREEDEKMDVRTALLNLENTFGDDDSLDGVFQEACQYHDSREIHDRLRDIYIKSAKLDKADALFESMTSNKSFTQNPSLWLAYASFLSTARANPAKARALLQRATQSVPGKEHRYLTAKFAALEFKSPNGDPERGRTIFEGLLSTWPKKWDLWDMFVDLEMSHGEEANVRDLFERMASTGGQAKLKKKRAKYVFKKWLEWEEKFGNKKGMERVKELAKAYVDSLTEGGE